MISSSQRLNEDQARAADEVGGILEAESRTGSTAETRAQEDTSRTGATSNLVTLSPRFCTASCDHLEHKRAPY